MTTIKTELTLPDDAAMLVARLFDERPADIIEELNRVGSERAAQVLCTLPADRAIEVLDTPGLDDVARIVAEIPPDQAVQLLGGMSADRLADLVRELPPQIRGRIVPRLDAETRAALERLLGYPEDSAGALMTTEFVAVPANWTVAAVLDHIRTVERSRETVYSIFALDGVDGPLLKAVPLRRLVTADPALPIGDVVVPRKPVTVDALASRDDIARLIARYDLLAVPVVDERGFVIGIVTVDDVIDAMVERQTEQVQRFGGLEALDEPYMDIGFWVMIRKRAGWLCVLFLSEMLTASAMQGFEGELEKAIVLTLFIPLIMSSGGNSGSQATSLLIRALALHQIRLGDWWRVALRELPAGVVLGGILGTIGIARITIWQLTGLYDYGEHWLLVAVTVGLALIGIVTFGSLSGSMLPFILQRVGFDPASASAPFVATLVDVSGLLIYFSVALLVLHGTLL